MVSKVSTVLWFDKGGEAAAKFYVSLIPNSRITNTVSPPMGEQQRDDGDALVVEFELNGSPYQILSAGPHFKQSEAVSIMVQTDDQAETDRYWNAITQNGGEESQCGWCKDKWGFSWQITPRVLIDAFNQGGETAKRAFEAMMPMKKIDVATIEAAVRGETVNA